MRTMTRVAAAGLILAAAVVAAPSLSRYGSFAPWTPPSKRDVPVRLVVDWKGNLTPAKVDYTGVVPTCPEFPGDSNLWVCETTGTVGTPITLISRSSDTATCTITAGTQSSSDTGRAGCWTTVTPA